MHEVGTRESDRALDGLPEALSLDQRDRDGEPEEREPDQPRQDQEDGEKRDGSEHEHTCHNSREDRAPSRTDVGGERARGDVADSQEQRTPGRGEEQPSPAGKSIHGHDDEHGADANREPSTEAAAIQTHCLGDELAGCPRLGRRRRGKLGHPATVSGLLSGGTPEPMSTASG